MNLLIVAPFAAGVVAGLLIKGVHAQKFYLFSNYITTALIFFAAAEIASLEFNIFSVLYKSIALGFLLSVISFVLVYLLVRSKNVAV